MGASAASRRLLSGVASAPATTRVRLSVVASAVRAAHSDHDGGRTGIARLRFGSALGGLRRTVVLNPPRVAIGRVAWPVAGRVQRPLPQTQFARNPSRDDGQLPSRETDCGRFRWHATVPGARRAEAFGVRSQRPRVSRRPQPGALHSTVSANRMDCDEMHPSVRTLARLAGGSSRACRVRTASGRSVAVDRGGQGRRRMQMPSQSGVRPW